MPLGSIPSNTYTSALKRYVEVWGLLQAFGSTKPFHFILSFNAQMFDAFDGLGILNPG